MSSNLTHSAPHLENGSACPPKGNLLRLYSMRYCPFVQRTRLVLAHKSIPHDVVNINLKRKPDWFLEKTPTGLVPVLEEPDGFIIYESTITCEYLDNKYPEKRLNPTNPARIALERMFLDRFSGTIGMYYRILRREETDPEKGLLMYEIVEEALTKSKSGFLSENEVGMLDYMVWPWIERTPASMQIIGYTFPESKFPKLLQWIDRMRNTSAVKETVCSDKEHVAFFTTAARSGNYDNVENVAATL